MPSMNCFLNCQSHKINMEQNRRIWIYIHIIIQYWSTKDLFQAKNIISHENLISKRMIYALKGQSIFKCPICLYT